MEKRRIQLTGGFTYTVSLPKKWAREVGIKHGDYVSLIPQPDMSLLIVPERRVRLEEAKEITVTVDGAPEEAVRNVIAAYLSGCDVIKVLTSTRKRGVLQAEGMKAIKETIRRKLVGAVVIGESATEVTIKCLVKYADLPIKDVLNRMYVMVRSMCSDVARALQRLDVSLLNEIWSRDDEVDKFYLFALRQLKEALVNREMLKELGLRSSCECLSYQLVARSLERMGDHASRVSQLLGGILLDLSDDMLDMLIETCGWCVKVIDKTMSSFEALDVKLANSVLSEAKKASNIDERAVVVLHETAVTKVALRTLLSLRIVMESLKRIIEYCADIAEVTIDLSALSEKDVRV